MRRFRVMLTAGLAAPVLVTQHNALPPAVARAARITKALTPAGLAAVRVTVVDSTIVPPAPWVVWSSTRHAAAATNPH